MANFLQSGLICVFLLLTATGIVKAQYQIKSWTTDDGLPQNTARSIVQTPDGYLWAATLDGLVRFDGARFTVFNKQNAPGIAGNRLTQILLDSTSGDLWIATEESDVTRYRDGVFEHFEIAENAPKKSITNLVFNEQGELLALTATKVFKRTRRILTARLIWARAVSSSKTARLRKSSTA